MTICDQKQRQEALNPQYSFLVKAPAGSGKTTLLIARIEQLLKVSHPSQITALTFTKNSAKEMAQRLHEKNPQATEVQIATYDAWIAKLLRKLSPEVSPPITQNPEVLYQMAWKQAFASAQNDIHHPLSDILNHHWQLFPLLKKTCIHMLGKRDQWLPLMFEEHSTWVTHQWQMMFDHCYQDLIGLMGAHWLPLRALFNHCQGTEITTVKNDLDEVIQMAQWLLTKTGTVRKPTQKMGFEPKSSAKDPLKATQMKEEYLRISDTIQENPNLLRLWQIFQKVQTNHVPTFLEHIARFLPELIAHLKLVFQEQHEVDYCENALNLLNILKSKTAQHHPELRQTQHLLLDEFQDTSPLQYAILGAFIDEWSDDQDSSLFLVGDPMQSIYGFRNADVRLILNIEKQKRFHHLPIKTLQLKTNFRSNQALIAFQNQVFSDLMSPQMDINWCDIVYQPSIGIAKSVPCVHQYDLEEDKYTQILHRLQQLPTNETIGILTPTRKSGLNILTHLQSHLNEPILGTGLSQLTQTPLIHDTLILFHAIHHPFCHLTWSALFLTPWINVSFSELQAWCQKNQKKSLYLEALNQPSYGIPHQISQLIHEQKRTHTPFQTLITALNYFDPKILNHPDLQSLLTALEQLQIPFENLSELFMWANQIEHSQTESKSRICITTIHQSKGLEYDHVILPDLNNTTPPTKPDIISIDSWINQKMPLPITLMASPVDASYHQNILNLLQKYKIQQEKKRLLYVALTRAKQGLHLFFDPMPKKNTAQDWLSHYF